MAKNNDAPAVASQRLSIPLTPDGLIDLDHMRPSTAEKLITLIKTDPTIRDTYKEETAGNDAGVPDVFGGITEENVSKGLDLVQSINAGLFRIVAARFIKHPILKDQNGKPFPLLLDEQILSTAFAFTPEQHKELDPRATRLAQKYSGAMPEWLKKNFDLYMFCSMFLAYTAQNAKLVLETQVKRDMSRAQQAFAAAQATQPRGPQPDSDARPKPANGVDHNPPPDFEIGGTDERPAA